MSIIRIEEVGGKGLDRATKILAGIERGTETAARRAMTRAVSHLRSNTGKAIRERYAISQSAIRANENVKVRYEYQSGVCAYITFVGQKIPLYRYDGASPKSPSWDEGKWVHVMVQNQWRTVHPGLSASGHQLRSTSPVRFENGFIARMSSSHTGIFERSGGATASVSDEIKEIMGSSVPQMLGSDEVQESLTREAVQKFEERLEHEINVIISGLGVR